MRGLLSNLTAALLALHTVLGCCWHHAHFGADTCAMAATIVSADVCPCDDAHRDGAMPNSDGQGHHGSGDCQGPTCVFANSSKSDRHGPTLSLDVPPVALLLGSIPAVGNDMVARPFYPPDALLPSVRLHLLCQVLLI
jgi:hypothetical protein